jgi:hypothetical protein
MQTQASIPLNAGQEPRARKNPLAQGIDNVVNLPVALGGGELVGEQPALIPEGDYQLRMTHWQTAVMWGRSQKVILHFTVCDPGEHFGVKLQRYYNVERIIGHPTKSRRFRVRWNQDLVREYCRLFPAVNRLDRVDLDRLTRVVVTGRVKTVTTSSKQKTIADAVQYSVVCELVRVEAGSG